MEYPGHLLLLSLGPIQDFIASARRCQDLWFGSWLLSDLSRAAGRAVQRSVGEDSLIFPVSLADTTPVANKILAALPRGHAPTDVVRTAREALGERLDLIRRAAFARFDDHPAWRDGHLREALLQQHLSDFLELQWVCTPLDDASGYDGARRRCEALLQRRKMTHTWRAAKGEQGVPKSSIDGVRESVLTDRVYSLPAAVRRNRYGVKGKEQLCGVALLKRLGCELGSAWRDERPDAPELAPAPADEALGGLLAAWQRGHPCFHSTSHMAAMPLLTRAADLGADGTAALDAYVAALQGMGLSLQRRYGVPLRAEEEVAARVANPWTSSPPAGPVRRAIVHERRYLDGVLLFESRLPEVVEECLLTEDEATRQRLVEGARRALRACLEALGVPRSPTRPTPYYGLLLADGDGMGRAIDLLGEGEEARERHGRLGDALDRRFSPGCAAIVEGHGGSLIYAGGDDVLALVPLHTALACARELHGHFRRTVVEATGLFPIGAAPEQVTPSLSVGIAVAHHMEALQDVRDRAKRAEALAKAMPGKNSLAILASKRSGGDLTVCGGWDEAVPLDRRLTSWGRLLRDNALPDGVAWHLEEVLAPFTKNRDGRYSVPSNVIEKLTRRAFSRRRDGGGEAMDGALVASLDAVFQAHRARDPSHVDDATARAVRALSEEIQMARLFLSAWVDAWGDAP